MAPMTIMTLVPGATISLITALVATSRFALVLAFFSEESMGKDILAATAAYAAVMVVFVGDRLGTSTRQNLKKRRQRRKDGSIANSHLNTQLPLGANSFIFWANNLGIEYIIGSYFPEADSVGIIFLILFTIASY